MKQNQKYLSSDPRVQNCKMQNYEMQNYKMQNCKMQNYTMRDYQMQNYRTQNNSSIQTNRTRHNATQNNSTQNRATQNNNILTNRMRNNVTQNHRVKKNRVKNRRPHRKIIPAALGILFLAALIFANFGNVKTTLTVQKLKAQNYPESLITLMERYPETTQFVLDYPKKADKHDTIDLSSEVTPGIIPHFLQWDERWGYETYGNDFLAVTGCGPTCLSMVTCGLRGDLQWNPYEVARMAETQGYYVDGVGSAWDLMDSGASALGLEVHNLSLSGEQIKETLSAGMPIICTVGPGDFTSAGHFIVLSGLDSDGKIKVLDPNSIKNSEKSWEVDDLIPQIKNLWAYS